MRKGLLKSTPGGIDMGMASINVAPVASVPFSSMVSTALCTPCRERGHRPVLSGAVPSPSLGARPEEGDGAKGGAHSDLLHLGVLLDHSLPPCRHTGLPHLLQALPDCTGGPYFSILTNLLSLRGKQLTTPTRRLPSHSSSAAPALFPVPDVRRPGTQDFEGGLPCARSTPGTQYPASH